MSKYDSLIKAFKKEWNIDGATIDQCFNYDAYEIRVTDRKADRVYTARVDRFMLEHSVGGSEDAMVETFKTLGKQVEYEREQMGLHPATGDKIFQASNPTQFTRLQDIIPDFMFEERKPKVVSERKKLPKYGRY